MNGDAGAKLINDQSDTLRGVQALITPDVLGIGSISVGSAQGVAGSIEFGHSVSRGQDVSVSGDLGQGLAGSLQIDKPREFDASVVMQLKSKVDLVGLAKADSYTFENDMLSIFGGNRLIDRLKLTNNGSFEGEPHDLVVSKSGSDVWLTQADLPLRQSAAPRSRCTCSSGHSGALPASRRLPRGSLGGRGGSGFQAAMARAHSRACAVSVTPGNSRRSSTAADSSPP